MWRLGEGSEDSSCYPEDTSNKQHECLNSEVNQKPVAPFGVTYGLVHRMDFITSLGLPSADHLLPFLDFDISVNQDDALILIFRQRTPLTNALVPSSPKTSSKSSAPRVT